VQPAAGNVSAGDLGRQNALDSVNFKYCID
jgi:hypothetical protein